MFPSGRRVVCRVSLHEQVTKNLKHDRDLTEISISAGKTFGEHKTLWRKVTLTAEILIGNQVRAYLAWGPLACCSRNQHSQCLTGNQVSNGGEQRQMESISRQQHLDSGRQNSFQSLVLNNVNNTSKKSVNLSVTSPFMNYAEVLNTNFRPTMVSTTSTPTPSTQTSPFYLLRDDARELTKLFYHLWFMLP